MSTWLDPIGPSSRSVYWRRRVVAAAAVLLALFFVARACGSDQPPDLGIRAGLTQTPVPLVSTYTPSPTPTPTPTPTGTVSGAVPGAVAGAPGAPGAGRSRGAATPAPTGKPKPLGCAKGDIEVTVRADARRYAPKVNPRLLISVVNRGQVACRFDVGSKALTLVVSSGKDRIWSSDDCQGAGTSDVRPLQPGKPFAAAALWTRVRSEVGCPRGQPAAKPGTYLVSGLANGVTSERRAVFMLA